NISLDYNINKKLTWKSVFSLNNTKSENQTFYNSNTPHGSPRNRALARGIHGIISYSETSVSSSENTLTYKNTFSKSHNLEVMGGLSFQEMKTITHGFGTMGIPDESLIMQGLELGLPY